ncbi:MAG: LptF/LptG family permease, partial [Kiritimatiellaeota bacterium]|nr:LptF/LptG family permease [Kiritimatiellota bacterium]
MASISFAFSRQMCYNRGHMRILPNYIARNYATTLVAALLVLNFVMSVGLMFKVMQFFARGLSLGLVWKFLLASVPGTLSYSIPVSILASSLLVFGRLSSDSEISAMRASGI